MKFISLTPRSFENDKGQEKFKFFPRPSSYLFENDFYFIQIHKNLTLKYFFNFILDRK